MVFSDLKVGVNNGIVAAYEYYPFGMVLDQVGGSYRYGFNGQEKDEELGTYTAEFWMYDARLGRRLEIDPVVKYNQSPYSCFTNSPI